MYFSLRFEVGPWLAACRIREPFAGLLGVGPLLFLNRKTEKPKNKNRKTRAPLGGAEEKRRGCVCVCFVFEASWAVWRRQFSLYGAPPQGVVCKAPLISEWVV